MISEVEVCRDILSARDYGLRVKESKGRNCGRKEAVSAKLSKIIQSVQSCKTFVDEEKRYEEDIFHTSQHLSKYGGSNWSTSSELNLRYPMIVCSHCDQKGVQSAGA